MLDALKPSYKIPSSKTIGGRILDECYCYGADCLILNRMQNDCVQWIRGNIIKETIVVFKII